MELLLRNIDTNTIRLIGMWRRDEMLCYLHVTEQTLMQGHAVIVVASDITPSYQYLPFSPYLPDHL